jgi:hypothetical protein
LNERWDRKILWLIYSFIGRLDVCPGYDYTKKVRIDRGVG